MKVAIIGTGNIGEALGGSLVRAGHDVTLAARDAAKTGTVAEAIGARAAASIEDAARAADVVVLAVPYASLGDVARALGTVVDGKVVIDVSNPLAPDYSGLATAGGASGAERLADLLPGAHVAKAFNTIFASLQAQPDALGTPVDGLFATDDARARGVVSELLQSAGFRPVDVGPLNAAGQLEAIAWLNIRMQLQFGGDWQSAFVLVGAPAGATEGATPSVAAAR